MVAFFQFSGCFSCLQFKAINWMLENCLACENGTNFFNGKAGEFVMGLFDMVSKL
jgi:hypothetical protein